MMEPFTTSEKKKLGHFAEAEFISDEVRPQ